MIKRFTATKSIMRRSQLLKVPAAVMVKSSNAASGTEK